MDTVTVLVVALLAGFAVAAYVLAQRPGRKRFREIDTLLRKPGRPPAPPQSIFISYRRKDSGDTVGRLYEHLTLAYGGPAVFKDVDVIAAGEDFRAALKRGLGDCLVFLCVMGPRWPGEGVPGKTARAIDDPGDFVRIEVEAALGRDVLFIPVLVNSLPMPVAETLPDSLRELCYRNALQLRADPDFKGDVQRICEHLDRHLASLADRQMKS